MRILGFNAKGGCGKSVLAREIIAALLGHNIVIVEIDALNKTQLTYKKDFKDVIVLEKENIKDLLIHLNEHENVVIDVGADNLTATLKVLVEYNLFEDIDLVVIPMMQGRTDCEDALKTYATISEQTNKIMFAFSRYHDEEKLEDQYPVFFNNMKKYGIEKLENYVTIKDSNIFIEAQNLKELVVNLAKNVDYKNEALKAKATNDMQKYHELMKKELYKRSAQILVNECIIPAHNKIIGFKTTNE